jgi:hypothetical protein
MDLEGILFFKFVDQLALFDHSPFFPGDSFNFILVVSQTTDLLVQLPVIFLQPEVGGLDPVSFLFESVDLHEPPASEDRKEEHAGNEQHEEKKVFFLEGPEKAHG